MKTKLIISFCTLFILVGCGSIGSVKEGKSSGVSVVYNTNFENAWVYTKKIFTQEHVIIAEENKDRGSIFGETIAEDAFKGSYIGVWIDPINDNEVNITVYHEKTSIKVGSVFGYEEFHKLFKLYVDTE